MTVNRPDNLDALPFDDYADADPNALPFDEEAQARTAAEAIVATRSYGRIPELAGPAVEALTAAILAQASR